MPEPPIMPTRLQTASFDEERREILTIVMGVLDSNSPDPDEMAACTYLLKHLTQYRRPVAARQGVESVMMDS
jgi:hypothetical protein